MTHDNHPAFDGLNLTDTFARRHIGPNADAITHMLAALGYPSLDALIDAAIPPSIRMEGTLDIGEERSEQALLAELRTIAAQNQVHRSYIGTGYHDCFTPPVILRNILENPGWYTAYTPYQAEIAQGRLEMLFNYQTMVADLTGLPVANASLLDEGTAAAEAMSMSLRVRPRKSTASIFFVSDACHPQTIEVVEARANALGVSIVVGDHHDMPLDGTCFGCLVQYPTTDGRVYDYAAFCDAAKANGVMVTMAADILSLCLLRSPGELGADIAVGNTQRFGVPMGYGGPHAAYFATTEEHKRQMPGRIIGLSQDSHGKPALRMALQTREQHIRRARATSNICTAQVLLAVIAGAFAVYHGPDGLRAIAERVRRLTLALANGLKKAGHTIQDGALFDTLRVTLGHGTQAAIMSKALEYKINLRPMDDGTVCVALDSTVQRQDIADLLTIFGLENASVDALAAESNTPLPSALARTSPYLTHPNFHTYRSETDMLRYLQRLQNRDLSLTHAMIPLGSCTMKLNATTEMIPVTWPEFGRMHPFAPLEQAQGYQRLFNDLERWLSHITGFDAVSLQPNAGSQGEYAGLLVIRKWHEERGDHHRNICLIPTSAHGTNPASAVMAGMKVVAVACDDQGNIDVDDLREKAESHQDNLAALMITYPSTHGVFEATIKDICSIIHASGGQVYMDGANMNAQVGLCRPGDIGADVCHLNLHKTFCIPHGGGGPGMGPIGVKKHLAPYLPGHPVIKTGGDSAIGAVSAAPWGSPSILPISWVYIALMGSEGLTQATRVAILSANYVAHRLKDHYPILYRGNENLVAHECIVDLRPLKSLAGVSVDDVAKRLMDYGFHSPTMSWPVAGTMMIEPTESEPLTELDRFCDAMIMICGEAHEIANKDLDHNDNVLSNAPHTAEAVCADDWTHPYSREQAAYPTDILRTTKYWPPVGRVDNAHGDRNLICTCPPVDAYNDN